MSVLPVVVLIRVVRPLVWIRFGYFGTQRIGHFAPDISQYLAERKLSDSRQSTIDLFFFDGESSNKFFELMSCRHLHVSPVYRVFYKSNKLLPGSSKHSVLPAQVTRGSRDLDGVTEKAGRTLRFTEVEERIGKEFTRSLGIEKDDKFVCLIVRDSAYLSQWGGQEKWSYHNYRDSDIDNYEDIVLKLAEKGYFIFRMGKAVNQRLSCDHQRVFDYANMKEKSDFLDIWLTAKCFFAISTSTGLDDVAVAFRRPVVFVNHLPTGDCRTGSTQFVELFKKLRLKKSQQVIGVKEQIDLGVINCTNQYQFDNLGIEIVDNSASEITAAVMELEKRLTGRWTTQPGDEELQTKFFDELRTWDRYTLRHGSVKARVSAEFLRDNKEWFLGV